MLPFGDYLNFVHKSASFVPGCQSRRFFNARTTIFSDALPLATRSGGLTDDAHHTATLPPYVTQYANQQRI